jgi:nitroreductase
MSHQNRRDFLKTSTALSGLALTGFNRKDQTESPTTIFDIIKNRRSVRNFKPDPVPEKHLEQILDAARMAPTSGNQQPWKFLVVRDKSKIDTLKETCIARSIGMAKQRGNPTEDEIAQIRSRVTDYYTRILSAPVYVVILTDNESKYPTYNIHDGPLAAATLMLAARTLGYGTCYFTDSISVDVTKEVFQIPDKYTRVCITPIGVPVEWPETPKKKELHELVAHENL